MYFKILADDLTHRGYTYKEGLNEDINPFNPTPKYGGGLFFADEKSILGFCGYGSKIAEVTLPEGEEIVRIKDKYKAHRLILGKIRDLWTIETFTWLINCGADIHVDDDYALRLAAENGYLEVVQYLLGHGADVHIYDDFILRSAAVTGYFDMVKCLVENGANIHADYDYAFRLAAAGGYMGVVRLLVEAGADIHACNDAAIRCAEIAGHMDMVKYLKSLC